MQLVSSYIWALSFSETAVHLFIWYIYCSSISFTCSQFLFPTVYPTADFPKLRNKHEPLRDEQSSIFDHLFCRHTNWYFTDFYLFLQLIVRVVILWTCQLHRPLSPNGWLPLQFQTYKLFIFVANPQNTLSHVRYKFVSYGNVCTKNHFIPDVCNNSLVAKVEQTSRTPTFNNTLEKLPAAVRNVK